MNVIVTPLSGFCPGVKVAENKIFDAKRKGEKLQILGKLIHNKKYIDYLRNQGIGTLRDLSEAAPDDVIVIRTHGISRNVENEIAKTHRMIDLTCFKVKQLQKDILKHSDSGFFVVITGKKDHPEVQGLVSYAAHCIVIEKIEEAEILASDSCSSLRRTLSESGCDRIFICSQTTASRKLLQGVAHLISECGTETTVHDSICSITDERETKALEIQSSCDITVVLGDNESSNATKLYKLLKAKNERTYFADGLPDVIKLAIDYTGMKCVQVVSSSSTPQFIEEEVVNYFESR